MLCLKEANFGELIFATQNKTEISARARL